MGNSRKLKAKERIKIYSFNLNSDMSLIRKCKRSSLFKLVNFLRIPLTKGWYRIRRNILPPNKGSKSSKIFINKQSVKTMNEFIQILFFGF